MRRASLTPLTLCVTIAGDEGRAAMPSSPGERYDFFLSRRGSVAAIAREVTDVLTEKGYKVRTQDYDIPITANFIEEMHEAVKNSRDLVVLFTRDYEQSRLNGFGALLRLLSAPSSLHCSAVML
jgi:hypothetical protein